MARAPAAAFILLSFFLLAVPAHAEPEKLLDWVAADFIGAASQAWQNFRVCELHSKSDDKRAFLSRSFGKKSIPSSAGVAWKELRTHEEGASSSLHLGLIAVTFREPTEANALYALLSAAEHPYLANTKILTQYKALRQGKTVLIAYSETFLHETLQRFFATVTLPESLPPRKSPSNWGQEQGEGVSPGSGDPSGAAPRGSGG